MINSPRGGWSRRKLSFAAILSLLQIVFAACAAAPAHWSYAGDTGPLYWHSLDPAYAIAGEGKAQSPIDIVTTDLAAGDALSAPVIAYRTTRFAVKNNGHTIELTPVTAGNTIMLDGESYALQQFHFHSPSEHLVDGGSFAMEVHLVHKDSRGKIAVVGALITAGAHNETLGGIFENLPREAAGEGSAEINLGELFAANDGMYRYEGSLTTPPCTEGVAWNIAMRPIELSPTQIEAFRVLCRGNNRPVQNLYGRRVYAVTGE
jgi:carbonic anhydrase